MLFFNHSSFYVVLLKIKVLLRVKNKEDHADREDKTDKTDKTEMNLFLKHIVTENEK